MARATNWDHPDPIRNIRSVKKTPGWVVLVETAVLMGLLSRYQGYSTCSEFSVTGATNWDHLDALLTQSGASEHREDPRMGDLEGDCSLHLL